MPPLVSCQDRLLSWICSKELSPLEDPSNSLTSLVFTRSFLRDLGSSSHSELYSIQSSREEGDKALQAVPTIQSL